MPYQNIPQRRNRYPYYGPQRNSYPQHKNLTSGIQFIGGDSVGAGITSFMDSMIRNKQMEYEEEKDYQERYSKLVDVSLKDVKGRWRDEAVKKKEEFLQTSMQTAMPKNGRLGYEDIKKIETGKEELQRMVGKSQEVQDWFSKASLELIKLKDSPKALAQTKANIAKIMGEESLDKAWEGTQSMDWYVGPEKDFDWKKTIYPKISKSHDTEGFFRKADAAQSVEDAVKSGDTEYTNYYDRWKEKNSEGTLGDFAKQEAASAELDYDEPKTPIWKPVVGEQDKKKRNYTMNPDGSWKFGSHGGNNKGAGLGTITLDSTDAEGKVIRDKEGNAQKTTWNDARMEQVKLVETDGVYTPMVVITYKKQKETTEEDQMKFYMDKGVTPSEALSIMAVLGKLKGEQSASAAERGMAMLPYKDYKNSLEDMGVYLEGIDKYLLLGGLGSEDDVRPPKKGE